MLPSCIHNGWQCQSQWKERLAKWLRQLTRKPNVRSAVGSNPMLGTLVAVRNSSPGRSEPCEGNLVAAASSCGELMVKNLWPLLEISLTDFCGLAMLNINTYLPILLIKSLKNNKVNAGYCGICSEERRRVTESSLQMPLTMF